MGGKWYAENVCMYAQLFRGEALPLNDLHKAINIDDAQHIAHKAWWHWGEANISKGTTVFKNLVCDVQALKSTRPIIHCEIPSPVLKACCLVVKSCSYCYAQKKWIKAMELKGFQTQIVRQSNWAQQSIPQTIQCNPTRSSLLTTKKWRQHQAMSSSLEPRRLLDITDSKSHAGKRAT